MNQLRLALDALRQYADPNNWQAGDGRGRTDQWLPPSNGPDLAREALEELGIFGPGMPYKKGRREFHATVMDEFSTYENSSTVTSDHPRIESQ